MKVFLYIIGARNKKLLFDYELDVSPKVAASLEDPLTGVYFDWGPDAAR